MASASSASSASQQQQKPDWWVEQAQVILPSNEKGQEEYGPMRECLAAADKVLRRQPQLEQRYVVLLTDEPKLPHFLAKLQQLQKEQETKQQLLIGTISHDNLWLLPALDVMVATPEKALQYLRSGVGVVSSSLALKALLIDRSSSGIPVGSAMEAQAFTFASFFGGFEAYERYIQLPSAPYAWYSPPRTIPASPAILRLIPGTTGVWDELFAPSLNSCAWGANKVAVQDWSDVPSFLPGIIRGSLTGDRASPPLLLAPRDKVELMTSLVRVCAALLGLSHLRIGNKQGVDHVLVHCPEDLTMPEYLERLVVIEADKLLDSHLSAWKIQRLVKMCLNGSVGLHFSSKTKAVEELLKDVSPVPRIEVTMEGVCQYFSPVACEDDKLGRVCEIWGLLSRTKQWFSIFCSSGDRAIWVAEELKLRGFKAWALCSGDEPDPRMYNSAFLVVVTNVYLRVGCDVINYDLPDSYDDYVERVGRDRTDLHRKAKVVINIGTSAQRHSLPTMPDLPRECHHLYDRLRFLRKYQAPVVHTD